MKIKHLLIAFLALTATLNLSCSKDDDNDNQSIVGTWELTKYTEVGTKTTTKGADIKTENINESNIPEAGKSTKVTFKSDGTYFTENTGEDSTNGKYTIKGNKITLIFGEDGQDEGLFSISGNTLTVVIDYNETYTSGQDNDLSTITIKTKDTQTFKRIK